jgi:Mn-dependent DtxR family transcriptional regulator
MARSSKTPGRSREDYLETILVLNRRRGWCREVDIASEIGYSRPSVSVACSKMEEEGLLTKEDSGEIRLTEKGWEIAEQTLEKHEFFHALLAHAGVGEPTAEEEACQLEHAVSTGSFRRLQAYLQEQLAAGGTEAAGLRTDRD